MKFVTIKHRLLAVKEVHAEHNNENIAIWLDQLITHNSINNNQIISFVRDTAANLNAGIKRLMKNNVIKNIDAAKDEKIKCLRFFLSFDDEKLSENSDQSVVYRFINEDSFESEVLQLENELEEFKANQKSFREELNALREEIDVETSNKNISSCFIQNDCKQHVIQLPIVRVIEENKKYLKAAKTLAKNLRTQKISHQLQESGLLKPKLLQKIRWNYFKVMIDRLLYLKTFILDYASDKSEIQEVLEEHPDLFDVFKSMSEAFDPCERITHELQYQNYDLPTFLRDYFMMIGKLEGLTKQGNIYAQQILVKIRYEDGSKTMHYSREVQILIKSPMMAAALFLDPSMLRLIKCEATKIEIINLAIVSLKVMNMKHLFATGMLKENVEIDDFVENLNEDDAAIQSVDVNVENMSIEDELDLLNSQIGIDITSNTISTAKTATSSNLLSKKRKNKAEYDKAAISFEKELQKHLEKIAIHTNFINTKEDPIKYWGSKEIVSEYPLLHNIALLFLSSPLTECDVERAFSDVSNVMRKNRTCLTGDILDDIIVLRVNRKIEKFDMDIQASNFIRRKNNK